MKISTTAKITIAAAVIAGCVIATGFVSHPHPRGISFSASTFVSDSTHIRSSQKDGTLEVETQGNSVVVDTLPTGGFFGLEKNDKISEIASNPITSIDDVDTALQQVKGDQVVFVATRGGQKVDIAVPREHGFDRLMK